MRLIQSGCVFLVSLALLLPACEKKAEITDQTDAATIPEDAGTTAGADSLAEVPALPDAGEEPSTGVFNEEKRQVARAKGRAPKGVDISLARQAAANRARANLAKLMKDKGFSTESPLNLQDATIERFYTRGRYVYAVAAMTLPEQDGSVNVPAPDPSNTHEKDSTGKTSTPPDGGQQ
jgi:hypothetical protein